MKFADRSVSKTFREGLAEALPGLAGRPDYWRFTKHLLFGTRKDADTGLLMIPAELVAAVEQKTPGTNYSARKFLDAYRQDVLHFEIEDYVLHPNPDRCRCRAVKSITLSPTVQALVHAERRRHNKDDQHVWMSTGNAWLRKHAAARRKADQAQAIALAEGNEVNSTTVMLLNYMNNLPSNRFTSALRHLPEAMAAAEMLPDADNQLNLLAAIGDNAQPFYQAAEKTTRAYSMRESILRLHRDLRKIMTQDWVTADLRSAQLAIIATVWHIPALTEYLAEQKSIWPDLCGHLGLEFNGDNKALTKRLLYALIFGAGDNKVRMILSKHFDNEAAAFRLLRTHSVIRSLIRARGRQMKMVRAERGAFDAFGTWGELMNTPLENCGSGYGKSWDNSRSILACVAQSYELKLLLPVIQLAVTQQFQSHGFTLTTWLHDGFTFDVHHAGDMITWKETLSDLVKDQAEALGIITGLDFG